MSNLIWLISLAVGGVVLSLIFPDLIIAEMNARLTTMAAASAAWPELSQVTALPAPTMTTLSAVIRMVRRFVFTLVLYVTQHLSVTR